jgi:hypothetical protein
MGKKSLMVRNEMMCFEVKVCKCGENCVFNLQDIRAQGIIERERKKLIHCVVQ